MNIARTLGVITVLAVASVVADARDLTTYSGDVFKNIEVVKKDATGMQVSHDDGIAFIDYKNLSEADQKYFGYDPATYAIAWQQKLQANEQQRQQQALIAQQSAARAHAQANLRAEEPAQDSWQPANQTGVQVTYDTPGFGYGPYTFGGSYVDGSAFPYYAPRIGGRFAPYPFNYYRSSSGGRVGSNWGVLDIRRR